MYAVMETNGAVTYHEADPGRQPFGGYKPVEIDVDSEVGARVLISSNGEGRLDANFPANAVLSGHQTGYEPLLGPVVFAPTSADGSLPAWLTERLDGFNARAR